MWSNNSKAILHRRVYTGCRESSSCCMMENRRMMLWPLDDNDSSRSHSHSRRLAKPNCFLKLEPWCLFIIARFRFGFYYSMPKRNNCSTFLYQFGACVIKIRFKFRTFLSQIIYKADVSLCKSCALLCF